MLSSMISLSDCPCLDMNVVRTAVRYFPSLQSRWTLQNLKRATTRWLALLVSVTALALASAWRAPITTIKPPAASSFPIAQKARRRSGEGGR